MQQVQAERGKYSQNISIQVATETVCLVILGLTSGACNSHP